MNNKIEKGDIVKIKKPYILQLENIDGEILKTEYGVVMERHTPEHICIAPYTSDGKMIFREHGGYILPNRADFNIKQVRLFLKGDRPDGSLIKD